MSIFVLILWFLYPAEDGTIKETTAPLVANVFTTQQECDNVLKRMIMISDNKIRGKCDEWK